MTRHAGQFLDLDHPAGRNPPPLRDSLGCDAERSPDHRITPRRVLRPNQCVHTRKESVAFLSWQALLPSHAPARKGSFQGMRSLAQRIRHTRDAIMGLTQDKLGEALGVERQSITNWERGKEISLDNLIKLADVSGVSLDWLALGRGYRPTRESVRSGGPQVPIVGYVGANAETQFIQQVDSGLLDTVTAPAVGGPETVAVRIRGDSLGALFDGWLAFYDQRHEPVTDDLLGRLCVCGLTDGRALIKRIDRRRDGLFDLKANHGETIFGAAVAWAARVLLLAPG